MGVDRPDVSFEVLPPVETLAAVLDLAHVHTRIDRGGGTGSGAAAIPSVRLEQLRRHPPAAAFLGQVGHGYREVRSGSWRGVTVRDVIGGRGQKGRADSCRVWR